MRFSLSGETFPERIEAILQRLEVNGMRRQAAAKKVRYADLLPHEFEARLHERPVGYLPLGTLEWHGPRSPLGAAFIQASAILERAAERFGGIVLPPIWLGPDDIAIGEPG